MELLARVPETDCYDSFDLDVLDSGENVRVNPKWERSGSMKLGDLIESVRLVGHDKEVFAADITGYCAREPYTGDARREKLVTVKSCLAVSVLAGEIMGLDTSRAREIMEKVDRKIKHLDYLGRKPECREAKTLELLERDSEGAPMDYADLIDGISSKS